VFADAVLYGAAKRRRDTTARCRVQRAERTRARASTGSHA
jgi:hypothetical protein